MLPDPPPGWIELQERAKRAQDPKELTAIIDEMNQLLAKYEEAARNGHSEGQVPARNDQPAKTEDH